jgi:hypothetical protein
MLNLAFQPCVMAMDTDKDHPCPHCPSDTSQEQHHRDTQVNLAADCDFVDTYSHDSRPAQSKNSAQLDDLPALMACEYLPNVAASTQAESGCASLTTNHSSGPPLNILYCIYLK